MIDWRKISLGPGRALFLASDHTLHSVPLEYLDDARAIDGDLIVLARSPQEWNAFVDAQSPENWWSLRDVFTDADRELLAGMKIAWAADQRTHRDISPCYECGVSSGQQHKPECSRRLLEPINGKR